MARCLVTGGAGFIGSHLSEALVAEGHDVVALDSFTDYYDPALKRENLKSLGSEPRFSLIEADLLDVALAPLLAESKYVFHLAAQPGVRASWGVSFQPYVDRNILATQRLIEACAGNPGIKRFVFSSSSSIYGDAETFPTEETATPKPVSPYGVTKLAGEHLAYAYFKNHKVPVVGLRYFTIYGPRQRPDMAFTRFIRAGLTGGELVIYGDGRQSRDFTYVSDAVEANMRAAFGGDATSGEMTGEMINVGAGRVTGLKKVLELVEGLCGKPLAIRHEEEQKGDVTMTCAGAAKMEKLLGFTPRVPLEVGLARQVSWAKASLGAVV